MNKILLLTLTSSIFIIKFKESCGIEIINAGASTSRQDLGRCEECEIENYATRLVNLMLAEDSSESNLTDTVNNRFRELEAFHDEIFSYILLVQHGAKYNFDQQRREKRLELFITQIRTRIIQILENACSRHYHHELKYKYDCEKNIIVLRETIKLRPDDCLCGNYRERTILNEPFSLNDGNPPGVTYQLSSDNNESFMIEASEYHIIPSVINNEIFQDLAFG